MSTSTSLNLHLNELHNSNGLADEDLNNFLEKFKILGSTGINANSIFYILNLHTMKYEFVNDACTVFTGLQPNEFINEGMAILPKIMVDKDFNLLSELIFPKMNDFAKALNSEEKGKVVFELYYKLKNKITGETTQMVEFSSYSKFDEEGSPLLSTGICYESTLLLNGVKGIVRMREDTRQITLFEKSASLEELLLTKTENEIAKMLMNGQSRKEIASEQNISTLTVGSHIKNIYRKLDVHKTSELKNKLL